MDPSHQQLNPGRARPSLRAVGSPSQRPHASSQIVTPGRDGSPSGPRPQALQTPPTPFPTPNPKFKIFPPPRLRVIRHQRSVLGRKAAFTLVESVVAIGLFAFVIVGIVGLFGSALERQRQASFETRSIMVSQQLLARIRAATSVNNVWLTTGSDASNESKFFSRWDTPTNFIYSTNVIYYKRDGTEISGVLQPNNYEGTTFAFAGNRSDSQTNDIVGRARISLSQTSNATTGNATTANGTVVTNLWRVTIEVSEPANLPLSARRYTNTFTTFATFPN